ncbi:MAG: tRNA epoxyqueuosine(34) reductase QueG [Rikenellaceae bacterium]
MVISAIEIKRLAQQAGFDLCGITRAEATAEGESHFREWLSAGFGDDLSYLHRNLEVRFDTSQLVLGARSVIVCAVNYKNEYSLRNRGGVACYALMRDYHKSIRKMLKGLLQQLPNSPSGRVFVDSAPLLEKHHAVKAGLGWIGRQSLLITPTYGSFVLLGEIVIDAEVDHYDQPYLGGGCGECRACLSVCPVCAINDNRTIDARRCISARTVEMDDAGDESLAGWVFGCDECQMCCPHNRSTPLATNLHMTPIITPPTMAEWRDMTPDDFDKWSQGTPLRRASLERIKRNIGR